MSKEAELLRELLRSDIGAMIESLRDDMNAHFARIHARFDRLEARFPASRNASYGLVSRGAELSETPGRQDQVGQ